MTQPASLDGVVETIVQGQVQKGNATGGAIAGAVIGGLLGNQMASQQTIVWQIGVRYDDGSRATIEQTSAPALRIGDRVRVSANGIQQL